MNSRSEAYKKMQDLFGENLTNSIFPEFGISEMLSNIIVMIQMICNILVEKGVITQEEYLKYFSEETLKKVANQIEKEAQKEEEEKWKY